MKETTNKNENDNDKPPSWWKRIFSKPVKKTFSLNNRDELINAVRLAKDKDFIANNALSMIEGVLQVDHLQARNIMLARSQIQVIHRDNSYRQILAQVLKSGHSRYPVIDENKDDIDGILHAKDLLKYIGTEDSFSIDDILRPPLYAPETQGLDELLTEFKKSRNHMAVIVDEYGGISGLVTIEDVLEQIVGEIDDEHDVDEKPNIQRTKKNTFTVNALTPIREFNHFFKSDEQLNQFDTIGGLVTHKIGKIPHPDEKLSTKNFNFKVLDSDGRRIQLLEVTPLFQIDPIEAKNSKPLKKQTNEKQTTEEAKREKVA